MAAPTVLDLNHFWVDSGPRAWAQRRVELRTLDALAGHPRGGRVLELGCGRRGNGLRLALDRLQATSVHGVELSPDSAAAARRAVRDPRVTVEAGDARDLGPSHDGYDVVLAFHVLHHTERWRTVVAEAARVLKPGGLLLSAEMTADLVDSSLLRTFSHHPDDGDRPTPATLAAAARDAGMQVVGQRTRFLGAWTAMVAVRP